MGLVLKMTHLHVDNKLDQPFFLMFLLHCFYAECLCVVFFLSARSHSSTFVDILLYTQSLKSPHQECRHRFWAKHQKHWSKLLEESLSLSLWGSRTTASHSNVLTWQIPRVIHMWIVLFFAAVRVFEVNADGISTSWGLFWSIGGINLYHRGDKQTVGDCYIWFRTHDVIIILFMNVPFIGLLLQETYPSIECDTKKNDKKAACVPYNVFWLYVICLRRISTTAHEYTDFDVFLTIRTKILQKKK